MISISPLAAYIGTKEGVTGSDRFEVLEQQIKNGETKYVRKGIIKVDRKHIWDNSYMSKDIRVEKFTTFKGAGNYYKGMLIRQIN